MNGNPDLDQTAKLLNEVNLSSEDSQVTALANGNRVLRALTNDKRILLPGSDYGVREGGKTLPGVSLCSIGVRTLALSISKSTQNVLE